MFERIKNHFPFFLLIVAIATAILLGFQQRHVKFLLTSEGSTGNTWLVHVLNSIPQISCTLYNRTAYGTVGEHIEIAQLSLAEYFKSLKKYSKHGIKAIGNVHGFTLNMLNDMHGKDGIKIANLIRHPISHVDSMYTYWLHNYEYRKQIEWFMLDKDLKTLADYPSASNHYAASFREALQYAADMKQLYGVTVPNDLRTWAFLTIVARLDRVHSNMLIADELNIPQYKFEEFTKDRHVLNAMIRYISDDKIKLPEKKIISLINKPAENVNRGQQLSEKDIYAAWSKYQKLAFALHLQKIGGITHNAYITHGYDLSFVDPLL